MITSPPYTLAPRTQDKWLRPTTDVPLTEARWVRAIEIKPKHPDGRKVVHHVLTTLLQGEDGVTGLAHEAHDVQTNAGLFMEWAVGKTGEIFSEDAGKLMLPGSQDPLGNPHVRDRRRDQGQRGRARRFISIPRA